MRTTRLWMSPPAGACLFLWGNEIHGLMPGATGFRLLRRLLAVPEFSGHSAGAASSVPAMLGILFCFILVSGFPESVHLPQATLLQAGETETADDISLQIGGEMEINLVRRSELFDEVFFGKDKYTARQDSFTDYEYTLDLLFKWERNISLFLQFENDEREIEEDGTVPKWSGLASFLPAKSSRRPERSLDTVLNIEQATIRLQDLFWEAGGDWDMQIGLQDVTYDFLGDGDAMMFDLSEAMDPWSFGGAKASYRTANLHADLLYGRLISFREDHDPSHLDTASLGIGHLEYWTDSGHFAAFLEGSMIELNVADRIWTLGAGIDYWPNPDMDFYAEGYLQKGRRQLVADGSARQAAFAYRTGIRFQKHAHPRKPYIDLSVWQRSGEKNPANDVSHEFLSLGDVDTTLIMEENDFGLGLRANYRAFKAKVGFEPVQRHHLELVLASFQRDSMDAVRTLGTEFDIVLRRQFAHNLTLRAGAGFLFDAEYFQNRYQGDDHGSIFRFDIILKF